MQWSCKQRRSAASAHRCAGSGELISIALSQSLLAGCHRAAMGCCIKATDERLSASHPSMQILESEGQRQAKINVAEASKSEVPSDSSVMQSWLRQVLAPPCLHHKRNMRPPCSAAVQHGGLAPVVTAKCTGALSLQVILSSEGSRQDQINRAEGGCSASSRSGLQATGRPPPSSSVPDLQVEHGFAARSSLEQLASTIALWLTPALCTMGLQVRRRRSWHAQRRRRAASSCWRTQSGSRVAARLWRSRCAAGRRRVKQGMLLARGGPLKAG